MIYSITSEMYHRYIVKGSGSQRAYQKKSRFVSFFLSLCFFFCVSLFFFMLAFFPLPSHSGVNPDKEKTGPPRDFTE